MFYFLFFASAQLSQVYGSNPYNLVEQVASYFIVVRSGLILGFAGIGLLCFSPNRDVLREELGWKENGVSDVGFSYPILHFEYVDSREKGIHTWLAPRNFSGGCVTRFVSKALA